MPNQSIEQAEEVELETEEKKTVNSGKKQIKEKTEIKGFGL